eukprot:gb/GEZN01015773.1/.p1 GENE.gb/GEZN01015773.1/~~gb/GEZN01015773.1/.p1  ORF type:complete len:152 (+),score=30.58 gb/GEZN01015773.1/:40-495(+)
MFAKTLKDHQTRTNAQKADLEHIRREALQATEEAASVLLESLNQSVAEVYTNQQLLERDAKRMHAETARFQRNTRRWVKMYAGLNEALKELGDVSNWAQTMEQDMQDLAFMLESVIATKRQEVGLPPLEGLSQDESVPRHSMQTEQKEAET